MRPALRTRSDKSEAESLFSIRMPEDDDAIRRYKERSEVASSRREMVALRIG